MGENWNQSKKKCLLSLSLSASLRAITRAQMLARQAILWSLALVPVTHVSRSPVCEKRSGVRGGRQFQNSSMITTSTQGRAQTQNDLLDGVLINCNSILVYRTGSKTNEPLKLIFGKYCENSLLLFGMLDASLCPT